jgi:hypothetical protein
MTIDTKRAITHAIGWFAVGVNLVAAGLAFGLGFTLQAAVHTIVAVLVSAAVWILDHVHDLFVARVDKARTEAAIAHLGHDQIARHIQRGSVAVRLEGDVRRRAN